MARQAEAPSDSSVTTDRHLGAQTARPLGFTVLAEARAFQNLATRHVVSA